MDRIGELSDELLVKILSRLPTRVAASTSILSKRWECLWMWLPKLDFAGENSWWRRSDCQRLRCFLDRNLPLHRAPVIESFCLKLVDARFKPEDIKLWLVIAVSRSTRELEIYNHPYVADKSNILPSSLYACKSLVTLRLDGNILLDVPRMVGLPSLKTLQLQGVRFFSGESLTRLLSICPLLEDLLVKLRRGVGNMGMITVIVPSLRRLSLQISVDSPIDGITIDTPSLRYFKFEDYLELSHSCLIENMPELGEAYADVNLPNISSLIGSITSVKRLTLSSEAVYGGGFVFDQLEHLKLCVGTDDLSNLLVRFLQGSPNLRVLDLFEMDHRYGDMHSWNQPYAVPKCITSSLQTLNWSGYVGRPQERDLAVYILKNACRLETATISSDESFIPKFEMIKELSLSSRASTSCQLIFD